MLVVLGMTGACHSLHNGRFAQNTFTDGSRSSKTSLLPKIILFQAVVRGRDIYMDNPTHDRKNDGKMV